MEEKRQLLHQPGADGQSDRASLSIRYDTSDSDEKQPLHEPALPETTPNIEIPNIASNVGEGQPDNKTIEINVDDAAPPAFTSDITYFISNDQIPMIKIDSNSNQLNHSNHSNNLSNSHLNHPNNPNNVNNLNNINNQSILAQKNSFHLVNPSLHGINKVQNIDNQSQSNIPQQQPSQQELSQQQQQHVHIDMVQSGHNKIMHPNGSRDPRPIFGVSKQNSINNSIPESTIVDVGLQNSSNSIIVVSGIESQQNYNLPSSPTKSQSQTALPPLPLTPDLRTPHIKSNRNKLSSNPTVFEFKEDDIDPNVAKGMPQHVLRQQSSSLNIPMPSQQLQQSNLYRNKLERNKSIDRRDQLSNKSKSLRDDSRNKKGKPVLKEINSDLIGLTRTPNGRKNMGNITDDISDYRCKYCLLPIKWTELLDTNKIYLVKSETYSNNIVSCEHVTCRKKAGIRDNMTDVNNVSKVTKTSNKQHNTKQTEHVRKSNQNPKHISKNDHKIHSQRSQSQVGLQIVENDHKLVKQRSKTYVMDSNNSNNSNHQNNSQSKLNNVDSVSNVGPMKLKKSNKNSNNNIDNKNVEQRQQKYQKQNNSHERVQSQSMASQASHRLHNSHISQQSLQQFKKNSNQNKHREQAQSVVQLSRIESGIEDGRDNNKINRSDKKDVNNMDRNKSDEIDMNEINDIGKMPDGSNVERCCCCIKLQCGMILLCLVLLIEALFYGYIYYLAHYPNNQTIKLNGVKIDLNPDNYNYKRFDTLYTLIFALYYLGGFFIGIGGCCCCKNLMFVKAFWIWSIGLVGYLIANIILIFFISNSNNNNYYNYDNNINKYEVNIVYIAFHVLLWIYWTYIVRQYYKDVRLIKWKQKRGVPVNYNQKPKKNKKDEWNGSDNNGKYISERNRKNRNPNHRNDEISRLK